MKNHIIPAFRLTMVMLAIVSLYLLFVYGGSKVLPTQGDAEIITHNGQKFYANIGQNFTSEKYFHGRPSAVDYNAAGSAGSNKGPSNAEYLEMVQKRIDTLKMQNPEMTNTPVPVELVTASGSGLDPAISPEGALYQVKRIAKVRSLSKEKIEELIKGNTNPPLLGLFGPSNVNVLKLNIALDGLE
ncbi:potassium-transporting ATPase subunit C [Chryseobacterium piperi]|uniref:Potassium-transporting ATPase KdpC subunit n=1 Tax=Chryseobacterium piperi TaxID=558152 RepID=A0A086B631_9FLAO|nr:K(+)-transporting ATPase subunit C [Chryseobacterium piperi]ASW74456.1 K(+)-transporting ATPase subunit C [Chryseobacterium piperi]KFF24395.1 potassium-transporting ATPase subunit C [Chryseobacterium piperi]